MDEVVDVLKRWKLDTRAVRERMYRAPTQRDRERWRAVWLLAEDWSAAQTADVLKRDPHTIGEWLATFRQAGPTERRRAAKLHRWPTAARRSFLTTRCRTTIFLPLGRVTGAAPAYALSPRASANGLGSSPISASMRAAGSSPSPRKLA